MIQKQQYWKLELEKLIAERRESKHSPNSETRFVVGPKRERVDFYGWQMGQFGHQTLVTRSSRAILAFNQDQSKD